MTFSAAAAAVAATSTLISGSMQSDAANYATDVQDDAARRSDSTNRYIYDTTRADNADALSARNQSLNRMRELLGISDNKGAAGYGTAGGRINPGDVTQEPGYKFGMDQGMAALNNQLAARGMRNSGAALKAAARYGTDYGSTKYDAAFNREVANRSAQLNPLQSLAGLAQTGASTVANAGQNYATNVGNNATNLGNALGAGAMAQGNIWGNTVNQLGSLAKGFNWGGGGIDTSGAGSLYGSNANGSLNGVYGVYGD